MEMTLRNRYTSRWKAAGIGLLVSAATLLVTHNDLFEGLELKTYDYWFHIRGNLSVAPQVVIANIDDLTAQQLGDPPWPRSRLAELVRLLRRAEARVVVFDLKMPGADLRSKANDQAFAREISKSGNVLLPAFLYPATRRWENPVSLSLPCEYVTRPKKILNEVNQISLPYPPLFHRAAGLGQINIYPERDGLVRKIPLIIDCERKPFPALALQAVRLFVGSKSPIRVNPGKFIDIAGIDVPIDDGFEMMLNFAGGYRTFPYYSVADILSGGTKLDVFRDKIVLVGATAAQQSSSFPTPVAQFFPSVEIQATAIDNILENRAMRRAPPAWNIALLLFLGPAMGFILAGQRPVYSWLYALAVGAGIAFTVFHLFAVRLIWVDSVRPLSALFWTYVTVLVYRLRLEEQETARTQSVIDTLMQISNIIGSSLDQSRLLQLFLEWITRMLNAEAGSILLLDPSRQNLQFEVATGDRSASVSQYSLKTGEGIAGWVAQRGEPVIANDVHQDQRFKREISEAIGFPTYSILCVPLRSKETIVGVIEVLNKKGRAPFTHADQEMLMAVANQAGVLLENARLYALLEKRVEWANRELVQANEELSVEKGKLEAIVRSMTEAVIVLDAAGKVVFANPAIYRVFHLEESHSLIGKPYREIITRTDLLDELQSAFELRTEREVKEFRIEEHPSRVFSAHLAPVRDSQNEMLGVVVVFSDITELKELDRAKSDFVSFVSHELRTPITTIKGFALTLLRSEMTDPRAREEFLRIMAQECDRMSRLIASILDLSRIEAGRALDMHLQEVVVSQILEKVVERNRLYATDHRFFLEVEPDLPVIDADADKLEQVLINLVGNAIKYSPRGGDVDVRAWREDARVVISVKDQGIGIAKDKTAKLFQRFQRVGGSHAEKIVGTGLGLYLTRHLVLAHGGDIRVESEEEKGSTFYVSLPLRQKGNPGSPEEAATT